MPKVSILLPNLNHRPFLAERFASIEAQTLGDWELIVVDGFSDDGSWEFIQAQAAKDSRLKIFQLERKGPYPAWNFALSKATGTYVYIATSDDSMREDCLEKMTRALDHHPDCGLCHCSLKMVGEKGEDLPRLQSWTNFPAVTYFEEWISRAHVRPAPHDGLLHCASGTIYTSIAQLLVRRTVFSQWGNFRADWGAIGDFEWGMRVSLLCNTFHLPEPLVTWRRHPGQLTREEGELQEENRRKKMQEMMAAAVAFFHQNRPDQASKPRWWLLRLPFLHEEFYFGLKARKGPAKMAFALRFALRSPAVLLMHFWCEWQDKGRFHNLHFRMVSREMRRAFARKIELIPYDA